MLIRFVIYPDITMRYLVDDDCLLLVRGEACKIAMARARVEANVDFAKATKQLSHVGVAANHSGGRGLAILFTLELNSILDCLRDPHVPS